MRMSINLQFVLKIIYFVTSVLIVILPLAYAFPEVLRIFPFYRNALRALDKLRKLGEEEEFYIGKEKKKGKVGRIRKNEKNFDDLIKVIKSKRKDLVGKEIVELGLVYYGEGPAICLSSPPQVEPNAIVYYVESEKPDTWQWLIFHPTAPEITLELKELFEWVNDYAYRRLSFYTILIVVVWGIILCYFVF